MPSSYDREQDGRIDHLCAEIEALIGRVSALERAISELQRALEGVAKKKTKGEEKYG